MDFKTGTPENLISAALRVGRGREPRQAGKGKVSVFSLELLEGGRVVLPTF